MIKKKREKARCLLIPAVINLTKQIMQTAEEIDMYFMNNFHAIFQSFVISLVVTLFLFALC